MDVVESVRLERNQFYMWHTPSTLGLWYKILYTFFNKSRWYRSVISPSIPSAFYISDNTQLEIYFNFNQATASRTAEYVTTLLY